MNLYKKISFVGFMLLTIVTLSQPDNIPIKTKEQNQSWLWELEMMPLKEQIAKIQKRILADTSIYESQRRITVYSYPEGNMPVYIIDKTRIELTKETTLEILLKLNKIIDNLNFVKVMDKAQGTSLYGARATGGVIWLKTNDENYVQKQLEEFKLAFTPF